MGATKTVRSKHLSRPSSNGPRSERPAKKHKKPRLPTPKQQKTKRALPNNKPKKRRVYTDEELGIPKLNATSPVGVHKPKGKKKGKVFVDDADSMMTILAMVNADKEGQVESKMMKARQLEEIREARRKEAESKEAKRKAKLEETKDTMKTGRKRKPESSKVNHGQGQFLNKSTKRVAFA